MQVVFPTSQHALGELEGWHYSYPVHEFSALGPDDAGEYIMVPRENFTMRFMDGRVFHTKSEQRWRDFDIRILEAEKLKRPNDTRVSLLPGAHIQPGGRQRARPGRVSEAHRLGRVVRGSLLLAVGAGPDPGEDGPRPDVEIQTGVRARPKPRRAPVRACCLGAEASRRLRWRKRRIVARGMPFPAPRPRLHVRQARRRASLPESWHVVSSLRKSTIATRRSSWWCTGTFWRIWPRTSFGRVKCQRCARFSFPWTRAARDECCMVRETEGKD